MSSGRITQHNGQGWWFGSAAPLSIVYDGYSQESPFVSSKLIDGHIVDLHRFTASNADSKPMESEQLTGILLDVSLGKAPFQKMLAIFYPTKQEFSEF